MPSGLCEFCKRLSGVYNIAERNSHHLWIHRWHTSTGSCALNENEDYETSLRPPFHHMAHRTDLRNLGDPRPLRRHSCADRVPLLAAVDWICHPCLGDDVAAIVSPMSSTKASSTSSLRLQLDYTTTTFLPSVLNRSPLSCTTVIVT